MLIINEFLKRSVFAHGRANFCWRLRERFERELSGPNESRCKSRSGANITPERSQLTWSQTQPLVKDACFFRECRASYRETLFNVRTLSDEESLRKAPTLSDNQKLAVKFNTAVAYNDAHSIDIKYHKNCWLNSVTNILYKLMWVFGYLFYALLNLFLIFGLAVPLVLPLVSPLQKKIKFLKFYRLNFLEIGTSLQPELRLVRLLF